jgi:hypothetical protein
MSFLSRLPRTAAFSALLAAVVAGSLFAGERSTEPAATKAREALRELPIRFEPNLGRQDSGVRFSARAGGYILSLKSREAVLSVPGREVGISLVKSNPSPKIEGSSLLRSTSNYFLGNQKESWRTSVPQYSRVRYAEVYPGIDLVYYGNQNHLEYDFVLRPGADPRRIRMKFRGANRLSLTREGDLRLELAGRELVQKKPLVYQQETGSGVLHEVSGRYTLIGKNLVGIKLGSYDRSRPLVIDPVLVYSSLLGASSQDAITCVKVDQAGMVYVAGYVGSNELTGTDGSYQAASAGGQDIFVAKLDPQQSGADSLLYLTYIGGAGAEAPNGMALDDQGSVYLTGWTNSFDFPPAGASYQTQLSGGVGQDAFVLKLNPSVAGPEALVYSTYLGGTGTEAGCGVGADQAGAIYVVGTTESADFPLAGAPIQNGGWGGRDAFIAKLDPSQLPYTATLVYSSYMGGENLDDGRAIVVADTDRIWITGSTLSAAYPVTGNAFQTDYHGNGDAFVSLLDISKPGYDALLYSTYIGGADDDEAQGLALDSAGRVLVAGFTLSSDFPTTTNAVQLNPGGNGDAFLIRLDPAKSGLAAATYSTYLGGSEGDVAFGVAADTTDNVYVTGYTLSPDFPVTVGALQNYWGGGINAFFTQIDLSVPPGQALVQSTYIGQAAVTVGNSIAASKDGKIYVAGSTEEPSFGVSDGAFQGSYGGGLADGFVMVVGP